MAEAEGYLAEDRDTELRWRAPVACRLCTHLLARESWVLDGAVITRGLPQPGLNAEILGTLLLTEAGRHEACPFCSPMKGLLPGSMPSGG